VLGSLLIVGSVGCGQPSANQLASTALGSAGPSSGAPPSGSAASTDAASQGADTAVGARVRDDELPTAPRARIDGTAEAGCDARILRGWVRVSCPPPAGDKRPAMVKVTKMSVPVESGVHEGVQVLTATFPEGVEVIASFVRGDEARELRLTWPKGAPRPETLGVLGAPSPYVSPCKALKLSGFGTSDAPCIIDTRPPFAAKWTGSYGRTPADPDRDLPLFDVENQSDHVVSQLSFRAYYYDAKGQQLDEEAREITSSSLSGKYLLQPSTKETFGIGRPKDKLPAGTATIEVEVTRYAWDQPDDDLYFEPAPPPEKRPRGGSKK
jgi:hypothetical protein